ncbi:MAG: hypothetical protein ACOX4U_02820 [Anaerovoracaceae bacterium]|jgi:hypothetical protein
MRSKVNTAYLICNEQKFCSIKDAEKEVNRIRAICLRLKNKQDEEISFILGVSVTNTDYIGKMGYDKPKNQGGKKQFICADNRLTWNPETGGRIIVPAPHQTDPHIHIMVNGYGASNCAEKIIKNLKKRNPDNTFSKTHLKTPERIAQMTSYIEEQSTILRHV